MLSIVKCVFYIVFSTWFCVLNKHFLKFLLKFFFKDTRPASFLTFPILKKGYFKLLKKL